MIIGVCTGAIVYFIGVGMLQAHWFYVRAKKIEDILSR